MIPKKYLDWIKKDLLGFAKDRNIKIFVFGSSVTRSRFGDIDIALEGDITNKEIYELKDYFEDSCFPYFVDIVNLNEVNKSFKENIINNPIIWIKH